MTIPPMYFKWLGSFMAPTARFSRLAERTFTSGYTYRMIVEEERSAASHRQYMAAVHEGWMQLPEPWDIAFPTEDHLRKYLLIKAGFCDITKVVGDRRVPVDGYAIVCKEDGVLTVYQAKSQSYKAMGKEEFAKSKTAVLDLLADMIGITTTQLLERDNGAG
jgi:hypothetical protein